MEDPAPSHNKNDPGELELKKTHWTSQSKPNDLVRDPQLPKS